MSFYISGTGSAVPEQVITNDDLSRILDTSDEWIRTRTGIESRYIIKDETLLSLSVGAGRSALENAGISPAQIDLVVCSTLQGDYISPSLSCLIAKELGISCGHLFDINMGCCGFLYALELADAYIASGKARHALIVSAEAMSRMADWTDRSTCVLFGDGAGAAVLSEGAGLLDIHLTADGNHRDINVGRHRTNCPYSQNETTPYLYMDGQEIYKFAVSSINRDITEILGKNGLSADDVDYFLLHQANMRIIQSAKHRLKQPDEKFPCNIAQHGNTSSASVPILLDEVNRSGLLKPNDLLALSAFGAGLSTGVCLLRWVGK